MCEIIIIGVWSIGSAMKCNCYLIPLLDQDGMSRAALVLLLQ
jgi:hypothetical protein